MNNYTIIEAFSHAECLYSQVLSLKGSGSKVHFIGNSNLKERIEKFGFTSCYYFESKEATKWRTLLKVRNEIISNNSNVVIFNTAQGNFVRAICLLPFPKKIKFVGIMHNAKKFSSSFSQKVISHRIKRYFVLNDYIKENEQLKFPELKLESFYPIFFPDFNMVDIEKPDDEIWITIPGAVESNRKDFKGFFELISKKDAIPKNIKFILLGKCKNISGQGLEVINWVKNHNIEDRIKIFTSFISDELFHSYLRRSDYIMPLLQPKQSNYNDFLMTKISGSFNLAFAYKKPLFCYDDFMVYDDFKENAISYNYTNFRKVISQISQKQISLPENLYLDKKWTLEYQKEKYISLLNT